MISRISAFCSFAFSTIVVYAAVVDHPNFWDYSHSQFLLLILHFVSKPEAGVEE